MPRLRTIPWRASGIRYLPENTSLLCPTSIDLQRDSR
jgi:hypothetical protein